MTTFIQILISLPPSILAVILVKEKLWNNKKDDQGNRGRSIQVGRFLTPQRLTWIWAILFCGHRIHEVLVSLRRLMGAFAG